MYASHILAMIIMMWLALSSTYPKLYGKHEDTDTFRMGLYQSQGGHAIGITLPCYAVLVIANPSYNQSKAIILGSAINQDGRSSGLTAPNGPSQSSLVSIVMSVSNIAPSSLSFVALHGTGTPLGDPIEMSALGVALTQPKDQSLKIFTTGSVKACYGHTEGAAGVTGMLKSTITLWDAML